MGAVVTPGERKSRQKGAVSIPIQETRTNARAPKVAADSELRRSRAGDFRSKSSDSRTVAAKQFGPDNAKSRHSARFMGSIESLSPMARLDGGALSIRTHVTDKDTSGFCVLWLSDVVFRTTTPSDLGDLSNGCSDTGRLRRAGDRHHHHAFEVRNDRERTHTGTTPPQSIIRIPQVPGRGAQDEAFPRAYPAHRRCSRP